MFLILFKILKILKMYYKYDNMIYVGFIMIYAIEYSIILLYMYTVYYYIDFYNPYCH